MLSTSKRFITLFFLVSVPCLRGMGDEGAAAPTAQAPAAPVAASSGPSSWQADELQNADVTTVNEERGNWFFKAKTLKEARKVYEKIRKKLAKIEPIEAKYSAERNKVDEKLNNFYHEYGFKSGELSAKLSALTGDVKKLEDAEGSLDPDERLVLVDLKKKQEALEEFKKEFAELQKLDAALNQAVVTLGAEITKANDYDEQAWKDYEKIELVLSDEIAEDLLRKIENAFENITAIETYLNSEFKGFFQKSAQAIDDHSAKIKKQVEELKDQGVALGKKMADLLAKEEAAKKAAAELIEHKKTPVVQSLGWFDTVVGYFTTTLDAIQAVFVSVYEYVIGLFGGTPQTVPVAQQPEVAIEPVVTEPKIIEALVEPVEVPSLVAVVPEPVAEVVSVKPLESIPAPAAPEVVAEKAPEELPKNLEDNLDDLVIE